MGRIGVVWIIMWLSILQAKEIFCDAPTWRSGPPDGLPELTKLSVDCGKEEMTIYLEFSSPYDGTIYSKSNGQSTRCVHVAPHSRITDASFSIEYNSCGTRSDPQGKFYENTIIIQYDDIVIEAWDEAKKIRCEWHDGYEKSAYKMPITISDLDVVEMNFQGDDVDCWLEVQDGKGPWSAKVEGLVALGSPLTLVVAIQDSEGQFDMRVKSCIAHDGHKHPIHLTDEDGCVLRPKMMTPFQKTSDTKGTASVIAYSHFYAFKFPETVEVTIQCTVEICRHGCPGTCMEGRDSQQQNSDSTVFQPPPSKEGEDIPTYKDSHPFSTVVTSQPGDLNYSASLNTSSSVVSSDRINASKEEDSDPLKSSSNNNHNYFMHYPYDLLEALAQADKPDYVDEDLMEKHIPLNEDDIYYSQPASIFRDRGKNFPKSSIIHDVTNKTSLEQIDNLFVVSTTDTTLAAEISDTTTEPNLSDQTVSIQKEEGEQQSFSIETADRNDLRRFGLSESKEVIQESEKSPQDSINKIKFENLNDSNSDDKKSSEEIKEITTLEDANVPERSELNVVTGLESSDYNEALVESKEHPEYEFRMNKKVNDVTQSKIITDPQFEEYNTKLKNSVVEYDTPKYDGHHLHYHPHLPVAPIPPLTLYNGVPLYYYGQSAMNSDFFQKERHPYLSRYPYQKEYVLKSKLRRPGRRRGRRDIGEKEQLGLKQTLRVIAPSDLDFNMKDNENAKPLYVGKADINVDICVAPSSFAAGLGLLLLGNICVLCVVVFLGYHYYLNKKSTVKTVELLCTELS